MDRAKFQELLNTHMEWVHKNPKTRKVYRQRSKRGEKVPDPNEDNLVWAPKAKAYPCEDCDCIVVNPSWNIVQRFNNQGKRQWQRYCKQCQKYFVFNKKLRKNTK